MNLNHTKPEYNGNSIVNLMSSILKTFNEKYSYPLLKNLNIKKLKKSKNIILIVLDGFGYHTLQSKAKGTIFEKYFFKKITSVFPSTTATAITTLTTGVTAQQHGFVGWFANVSELGGIVTLLPFIPRIGGINYGYFGVDPKKFLNQKTIYDKIKVSKFIIEPDSFKKRKFSLINRKKITKFFGYKTLNSFFVNISKAVKYNNNKKFIWAYWPMIDSIGHRKGINSKFVNEHIQQLDKKFRNLIKKLKNTNTTILITADHGLVDIPKKNDIDLNKIPGFHDTLSTYLTGEGRAGYLFVRAKKDKEFKAIWKKYFSKYIGLYESEKLVKMNYFGLKKPSKEFLNRIGDYMLIAKNNYKIHDNLIGQKSNNFIGHHGGLSKKEMEVPLIVINL